MKAKKNKKKRSLASPAVALVGSLTGKGGGRSRRWRRKKRTWPLGILSDPKAAQKKLEKLVAQASPGQLGRGIPNRRKRKAIAKRLSADLDRASNYAGHVGAVLGVASAAAELVSTLRREAEPGEDTEPEEESGPTHVVRRSKSDNKQRSSRGDKEVRRAS